MKPTIVHELPTTSLTFQAHIIQARERLMSAGLSKTEATLDAELLLRKLANLDRGTLLVRRHETAGPDLATAYRKIIRRRELREPVHLILGVREFWGRDFKVSPHVLVPRPETELIIETAMTTSRTFSSPVHIVDAGTGSGCLAITLALELPSVKFIATDISSAALTVARQNARRHNVSDRIQFMQTNFLENCTSGIDIIVSNPPYIQKSDMDILPPEVRNYEPSAALFGGHDGLDCFRVLFAQAETRLINGGWIIVEFGLDQEHDIYRLASRHQNLSFIETKPDLQGIPRIAILQKTVGDN